MGKELFGELDFTNLDELIKSLNILKAYTPKDSVVYVSARLLMNSGHQGVVRLFETTLTDGSKVYDVEVGA